MVKIACTILGRLGHGYCTLHNTYCTLYIAHLTLYTYHAHCTLHPSSQHQGSEKSPRHGVSSTVSVHYGSVRYWGHWQVGEGGLTGYLGGLPRGDMRLEMRQVRTRMGLGPAVTTRVWWGEVKRAVREATCCSRSWVYRYSCVLY